ncbi:major facilitator superfamily domain-containing protein [Thamnocephalis sphaerospora]|uniref:Major facilitator superfamily domain-containing protein n=1 Tax=Thamnocephalis sphaerospora TaxID=78915 RepID=A0A4P9XJQ0_9FUNG|nr:major facilitator superfamily domain-containing protein [Thamnocephalis sphaerospora]|eukprot:RKP06008.1 major facilitator superfamily domain-containing protein [Thamnocephalis sphaerospora]
MLSYRTPLMQVMVVGLIMFCTSGMYSALIGMGGGGQVDGSAAAESNTALYACMAVFGLVAGGLNNLLGPRIVMFIGSLTFAFYISSFLAYNHIQSNTFTVVAGAILGVGAAMLWTAQGAIMMAYPTRDRKGYFIMVFWVIFNMGGVIGGLIPFAANYNSSAGAVNDGTYIAFVVLAVAGAVLCLLLASPATMLRDDGTPVVIEKSPSIADEVNGILRTFTDWRMLCMIPMFLSSNWPYSYMFNSVNGFIFNVRTRGLNNAFFWGAQMAGAFIIGRFFDSPRLSRSNKALYSLVALSITYAAVWGGGLALQLQYSRQDPRWNLDFLNSSRAAGPIILYTLYGLFSAFQQTWCYWVMGAITSGTAVLARYAGFFKSIQAIGAAIAWAIDAGMASYLSQFIASWAIFMIAVPFAIPVTRQIRESDDAKPVTAPTNYAGSVEESAD